MRCNKQLQTPGLFPFLFTENASRLHALDEERGTIEFRCEYFEELHTKTATINHSTGTRPISARHKNIMVAPALIARNML